MAQPYKQKVEREGDWFPLEPDAGEGIQNNIKSSYDKVYWLLLK